MMLYKSRGELGHNYSGRFVIHYTISVFVGFALHLWAIMSLLICYKFEVQPKLNLQTQKPKASKIYKPQMTHKTEKCSES